MLDHEFDPITPEEEARRAEEEELARRVRREVLRVQRGEADEDIRADEAAEAAEREARDKAERKARKRSSSTIWQLFTGTILIREEVSRYYRYMLAIAGMFFLSIVVMFWSLHQDMKFSRLEGEVQILRERSIRLEEQRYRRTTHSAVIEALREHGIELYDPLTPGVRIDE